MIAGLGGVALLAAVAVAVMAFRHGGDPIGRFGGLLVALALALAGLRMMTLASVAAVAGTVLMLAAGHRRRTRRARRRSPRYRSGGAGHGSTVRTDRIEVSLDHGTGRMTGRVLIGPHAGRALGALGLDALLEVAAAVPDGDTRTLTLLTSYLDRMHPGWAEAQAEPPAANGSAMTRAQALHVLGLTEAATRDDVIAAHRRLIKRVHPDVGGSSALTVQINAAKTLLLGAEGLS